MKKNNLLSNYIELSKPTVMIPVSLTGFTGYFMFRPVFTPGIWLLTLGILLMASSASVVNQVQEAEIDSMMDRTRNRPIPAGRTSRSEALLFSGILLVTGSALVGIAGNRVALLIGLSTIVIYNLIYTPLKKITSFAVFPGAITGALPPLIGWSAAGGSISDKPIVFLSFLIFVGQVPHFWLLVLKYGDEYRKAGLPVLTDHFNKIQIGRLAFTWVVTAVTAALFLSYFKIIQTGMITTVLLAASAFLVWKFTGLIKKPDGDKDYGRYSAFLNSWFMLIMVLLISDRLLS